MPHFRGIKGWLFGGLLMLSALHGFGQIDPFQRSLLQLGYDQPLVGEGPRGAYAYYYYNNPHIHGNDMTLRMAVAPAYVDGELGLKEVLGPNTDIGIGYYGGAFSDDFYEVRQGQFLQGESFDGYGGGLSLSLYQRLNPSMEIPLNLVLRGGMNYSSYDKNDHTDKRFVLPDDRFTTFVRGGLRLAGKEPLLYPALGMELSIWYEHQWRSRPGAYGFADDRKVEPDSDLFWIYGYINYTWWDPLESTCRHASLSIL